MIDTKRLYRLIILTSKYREEKMKEESCGVEVTEELDYFRDVEEALLELNTERMKKELTPNVNVDDFIGKECTVSLKDGRIITGFLSADSRYLNIVDKNTNEPYSFYGKDVQNIQGT